LWADKSPFRRDLEGLAIFFNKDFKYLPLFCRLNQAGKGFE
jgi:hypothetical protein